MLVSDIIPGGRMVCLIKGPPKTGKTIAAASWPGCYIMSNDNRLAPLATYKPLIGRKIEYDVFTKFGDFDAKLDKLVGSCPYDTVVYDNLTFGGSQIISYAMSIVGGKDSKDKGRRKGVIELPTIDDWQAEAEAIRQILEAFMLMPCHVIFIAHVMTKTVTSLDGQTSKTYQTLVSGTQKTASIVTGFFDEVYHMVKVPSMSITERPKHVLRTIDNGVDFAASALDLPHEIDVTNKLAYDELKQFFGDTDGALQKMRASQPKVTKL